MKRGLTRVFGLVHASAMPYQTIQVFHYVPSVEDNIAFWTMWGTWAAAIGSIFAAFVALWIASNANSQKIKVSYKKFNVDIICSTGGLGTVIVTNRGYVPIKIQNVMIVACVPFKCGKGVRFDDSFSEIKNLVIDFGDSISIRLFRNAHYTSEIDLDRWYFKVFKFLIRFDIVIETTVSCIRANVGREFSKAFMSSRMDYPSFQERYSKG